MSEGLKTEVRNVELRTIADALRWGAIHLECRTCGRLSPFEPPADMPSDTPLRDIRRKAKCRDCVEEGRNPKDIVMLLRDKGARGDRAWVPRPPGRRR